MAPAAKCFHPDFFFFGAVANGVANHCLVGVAPHTLPPRFFQPGIATLVCVMSCDGMCTRFLRVDTIRSVVRYVVPVVSTSRTQSDDAVCVCVRVCDEVRVLLWGFVNTVFGVVRV